MEIIGIILCFVALGKFSSVLFDKKSEEYWKAEFEGKKLRAGCITPFFLFLIGLGVYSGNILQAIGILVVYGIVIWLYELGLSKIIETIFNVCWELTFGLILRIIYWAFKALSKDKQKCDDAPFVEQLENYQVQGQGQVVEPSSNSKHQNGWSILGTIQTFFSIVGFIVVSLIVLFILFTKLENYKKEQYEKKSEDKISEASPQLKITTIDFGKSAKLNMKEFKNLVDSQIEFFKDNKNQWRLLTSVQDEKSFIKQRNTILKKNSEDIEKSNKQPTTKSKLESIKKEMESNEKRIKELCDMEEYFIKKYPRE